ncbi:MAG: GNAT family N-acetyltransferase [Bacillota bacterium]|uniref:GNAT family N-acetyltransferase n=1 Tax=Virgibacillus salarius TaxID=447199 RepID=A0A941DSR7_9BACI|nr:MULTISPECIES: GNAT family N-acetyltransferase [Bacillaceae]NAZ07211.1 GNAT family N-acetyltransferase [Agaribacter marinus]MBR7794489.1 GNAT family N-acetyltransferase [Virgibacillus salarius]MCC2252636.1 GNAT family N-acetyltransferase [Virgibacillus sp. AGTR]MDY7043283.1 GNAT family N-acetyltransferase [Virgibacillus sp. M23]QRZ17886.1 GNAT family N-acetyltransferase [Virgibacillus sp. AGTR]
MIKIKRLIDCTIAEAVKSWNEGFAGYYIDTTTTPENLIKRMVNEDLSPLLSIVAFKDNQPIGIVMNGVRKVKGKKVAWNGGTGVAKEYRSKGVGKILIESTLSILKEEGVDLATLEAISNNTKAISLYKNMGYLIYDNLEYLTLKGKLLQNPIKDSNRKYNVERVAPQQIGQLLFYKTMNPWQTQWQSAKNGEGIIVKDDSGNELGYAYYQKIFNSQGRHLSTILFQCESKPDLTDSEEIVYFMLGEVFGDFKDDIIRTIPNLPITKSELPLTILKQIGFQTIAQQVYMTKEM